MHNQVSLQQINDAIGAHGAWKLRLRSAIRTRSADITSHTASCDDKCAFGKWLYGPDIDAATRTGVPYGVIRRLHADFHRSAGSVLFLIERGKVAEAEAQMTGEFTQRSETLVRALNKWKGELM